MNALIVGVWMGVGVLLLMAMQLPGVRRLVSAISLVVVMGVVAVVAGGLGWWAWIDYRAAEADRIAHCFTQQEWDHPTSATIDRMKAIGVEFPADVDAKTLYGSMNTHRLTICP